MLDVLLRNGTVIDGTGAPGRRADVGVKDGRIVTVGASSTESAAQTIEADGLVVAPGFVDPHTHYDAQLFWDPFASPSSLHGVTTVIGGNCGFTLAPLRPGDADYIRPMMAKVEGMPLEALERGLAWDWDSFESYLARLDGKVGVNVGFLVGHCALRRSVMGDDAVGNVASEAQIAEMARLLHESLSAGGLGFSSSKAYTHEDGDSNPVPSRASTREEILALTAAVREHPGTTLEFIIDGCMSQFSDEEIDLMVEMSLSAGRPLNWNVMGVDAKRRRFERQLVAGTRAKERGARIVALTMPTLGGLKMSFHDFCALFLIPGWGDVMKLPVPERIVKLEDPEVRKRMNELARSKEAGVLQDLARWGAYEIGETFAPENAGLTGRLVADIARERGKDPQDTLFDIVVADGLRTGLWPVPADDDAESWKLRTEVWRDDRVLIGGSDAGAHLDRMCGARYPTAFLGDVVRDRGLLPIEEAIRLMTDAPARLFGLRQRGRIAEGWHADLAVFEPAKVNAGPIHSRNDLPGGTARLFSAAIGVQHVFANGREIVRDGKETGDLAGRLLRSGRDTETVAIPAG